MNPYVKAGWVFGNMKMKTDGDATKNYNPAFDLAGGVTVWDCDVGALRVGADWTYRSFETDAMGKIDLLVNSFAGEAYFDFKTSTAFTPYAGLKLGLAYLSEKYPGDKRHTKWQLAYGIGAGTAYKLKSDLDLDAEIRYMKLCKVNGTKYEATDFVLGVRFGF